MARQEDACWRCGATWEDPVPASVETASAQPVSPAPEVSARVSDAGFAQR